MAHNLEIKDGVASFVAHGEKAWHGLGTYVNEAMTSEQVVELANLNYEVGKTPIYVKPTIADTETLIEIPDISATYRMDNGTPSKGKKRYLPDAAWKALSSSEKAATNKAKAQGNKKGKQFVSQPKNIAKKTARYR